MAFENKHEAGCAPLTPCKNCREVQTWRQRLLDAPKRVRTPRTAVKSRRKNEAQEGEAIPRLGNNPRSLAMLKGAGYPTYESLDGVSRKKLAKIKYLGEPAIQLLERALEKRGMNLSD